MRTAYRIGSVLALVVLLLASLPTSSFAFDFSQQGPYGVGWRNVTVTRADLSTFTAKLYYPATGGAGADLPYNASGAPYPAITFGARVATPVAQYDTTLATLATWGFFVIASSRSDINSLVFSADLLSQLSWLESENANDGSSLFGQVNTARFGASGHANGGGAALLASAADQRIKTLAPLAAGETNPPAATTALNLTIPVRYIVGSADTKVDPTTITRPMYNNTNPAKQWLVITGGSHCRFLDNWQLGCDAGVLDRPTQLELSRQSLVEWFSLYLKGDQRAWRQIWGPEVDDDTRRTVEFVAGFTLEPAAQAAEGLSGTDVDYSITLTNTGPYSQSYSFFAEDNTWPITFDPPQTGVLAPSASESITVTVSIPAGTPASTETALVSGRSNRDGGTRRWVTVVTTAIPFHLDIANYDTVNFLSWNIPEEGCVFDLHRSSSPYFAPAVENLIGEAGYVKTVYPDPPANGYGNPDLNYEYMVRAICEDATFDSGYVGDWDFLLEAGENPALQ